MVGHADICFGSDHGILQWRFMVGQNLYKLLGMVPGWVWITIGLSVWIGLLTMYVASFLVVFLVQATQEHRIVSPLIAALPFWFRLLQCARRFHDTGPNGAFGMGGMWMHCQWAMRVTNGDCIVEALVRELGMYFLWVSINQCVCENCQNIVGCVLEEPNCDVQKMSTNKPNNENTCRLTVSGQKRHLLNLGKYAASLMVVVVSSPGWPIWKLVSMILFFGGEKDLSRGWRSCCFPSQCYDDEHCDA